MLADSCETPAKITSNAGLDVTEHTDTPPPLMTGRYVALGSSMAAGPGSGRAHPGPRGRRSAPPGIMHIWLQMRLAWTWWT